MGLVLCETTGSGSALAAQGAAQKWEGNLKKRNKENAGENDIKFKY